MSKKFHIAIAEALGYEIIWIDNYLSEFFESTKHKIPVIRYINEYDYDTLPMYSIDQSDMLELDEEMKERGWSIEIVRLGKTYSAYYFKCNFNGDIDAGFKAINDNEPLVRALAAYYALTGKLWEGE